MNGQIDKKPTVLQRLKYDSSSNFFQWIDKTKTVILSRHAKGFWTWDFQPISKEDHNFANSKEYKQGILKQNFVTRKAITEHLQSVFEKRPEYDFSSLTKYSPKRYVLQDTDLSLHQDVWSRKWYWRQGNGAPFLDANSKPLCFDTKKAACQYIEDIV